MGSNSMESYTVEQMQPLKAHVKNGQIVVDEPAELAEGQVFYLVPVDEDELDDEERKALHAELEACVDEMRSGARIDAKTAMAKLRARP